MKNVLVSTSLENRTLTLSVCNQTGQFYILYRLGSEQAESAFGLDGTLAIETYYLIRREIKRQVSLAGA